MPNKKKQKYSGTSDKIGLNNRILEIFKNNPTYFYNYKQISKLLGFNSRAEREDIIGILKELKSGNSLIEPQPGRYKNNSKTIYITGKLQMTSSNNGFVISDEVAEDVFIAQKNLNHALGGDVVKVNLFARREGRKLEGEISEIIERAHKQFVGIIKATKNFAFLLPDSKNIPYNIFIPTDKLNKAKNGQKAVAKITSWPKNVKNPFGEIIEVLGYPGRHETEMHAILAEFELPNKFSAEVLESAEKIPGNIPGEEIAKRRDFRQITTFTIDPIDAKDYDDALSYRKLPNNNVEVGVHIADVTYYVPSKSIVDEEAYERGTSVYLVDRVVPMLPERLSNNICSLKPDEDKLCFSAVFELDNNANVRNEWFGHTIINSNRRFNYDEAQKIIETGNGDLKDELQELNRLAKILRSNRMKNGAVEFDRAEIKFEIDPSGKPLNVFFKKNEDSNKLIEEFMLLANRRVAEFIGKMSHTDKNRTFVYRVHDVPNKEKLISFSNFVKKFGYKLTTGSGKKIAGES